MMDIAISVQSTSATISYPDPLIEIICEYKGE